ncbi:MAG TPA: wax ester/triacylglycerol synthase family O-acyltransferase [Nocardioidaceae bacterium]|nr:wax ester/triacylglycerol synthase family O-acyltransferase [Nocardioidaceae bacterium]
MSNRLIGPVDTIWLNMDRANNLMVIESLMFLDGPVDWDRLLTTYARRMLDRYPVFHQRPVMSMAHVTPPHWEDDPDFDLDRHVTRAVLERGDDADLQHYIEQRLSVPFDRRHPLWEVHFIDGYDGGSVVFSRLHHALADGIALTQVMLSLTDATPEGDLVEVAEEPPEESLGVLDGALRVVGAAASAAGAVAAATPRVLRDASRLLDPRRIGDAFTQAERTGEVANKLILGPHPATPFSGEPGIAKREVWCQPFPLDDVKHVGRMSDATVNDVLMATLAGALATYVRERGGTPEDVVTMVPVNVRPLDRPLPRNLGNQFALVLLKLPVGVEGPFARVAEAKRRMDVIKNSPEVMLTFGLIKAIGRSGPELERFFVDFFASKAIGVTTNVPGPRKPRYLAGTRISRVLGWAPESGDQTLGVSIFTYAGEVHVGFKVDATRIPDPERLVAAFEAEITELGRFAHAV